MPPEAPLPDSGDGRLRLARSLLAAVVQSLADTLPASVPAEDEFEAGFALWRALRDGPLAAEPAKDAPPALRHGLSPAEVGQALSEMPPGLAAEAVGALAEKHLADAALSGAQLAELRSRLVRLPSDLRALARPVRDAADFARVALLQAPRRFEPGQRTADDAYELQGFLGAGGFGEVWAARDLFSGERRALKFCLDDAAAGKLAAEVQAVRALYDALDDKEGLARFFRPNLHCDPPYLVMELCENGDLLDWMRRDAAGASPAERVAFLGGPVQALARAHAAGVVHRDIKPGNILIGSDGKARLGDFGFARATVEANMSSIMRSLRSGASSEAMSLGIAGTGLYMAPEVKRGRVPADDLDGLKRADVYSFGVTLAQALAGDPELEAGQLGRARRKALPDEIVELVDACAEPDPSERFADAGGIVAYLQECGLWNGSASAAPGPPSSAPPKKAEPAPPPKAEPKPPAPKPSGPRTETLDIGGGASIRLVEVPAGAFAMGSDANEYRRNIDEEPITRVAFPKPFLIGESPVTQGQWETVMGTSLKEEAGGAGIAWQLRGVGFDYPMYFVSWHRAMEFCERLTSRLKRVVSMPSEAQWEYACRAGSRGRFFFGEEPSLLGLHAWHEGNSHGAAHPVGQKVANAWGLRDMHGNVAEWCLDWKNEYPGGEEVEWASLDRGSMRVIRGGSWKNEESKLRSAARFASAPNQALQQVGFRVVVELP